jgi:hypothetical protein
VYKDEDYALIFVHQVAARHSMLAQVEKASTRVGLRWTYWKAQLVGAE